MLKDQPNNKIIDIIGFPMDLGAGRRGVDMGPSALRITGLSKKLTKLGYEVRDHGDIPIPNHVKSLNNNPKQKFKDEILAASTTFAKKVKDSLLEGNFPLCLGGDHSMAIGSIAGISSFCRDVGQKLGIIWIDAHADINTPETTPSGNIHGMPLAISLGLGDRDFINIEGFSPKVDPENCILIGIRSLDTMEKDTIRKHKIPIYTMTEIDKFGIHHVVSEAINRLKDKVDHIHVSFDMDSTDPKEAPGVGTPVPGGLTFRETHLLMELIAESGELASLDVVELNPILDIRNKSAEFAAEIIASVMGNRTL